MRLDHETIGTERLHSLGLGDVTLWIGAFVFVLALGAGGGFAASLWRPVTELPGAPPPALMIELAPMAIAPQVEDIPADIGPEVMPQETSEPAPEPEVEPELEPEPVEEPPEEVVEPPPDEPVVEEPEAVEEIEPEPEPVEPEPVEEVIPDLTESESADASVPMPVTLSTDLQQQRENTPKTVHQRPRPQPQSAPQQQTAPRAVEAQQSTQTAAPQQSTTTRRTPNISPEQWQSQVIAHIERNKRYPEDAKRRREEGIPHLQFTINLAGQVTSSRIVRSSGYPALDQAALELIARASPVPAPPASIAQNSITLTVPVNFNIR